MTTGTQNQSIVWVEPAFCGGSGGYRYQFTKNWSGGNRIEGQPLDTPHSYEMSLLREDRGLLQKRSTGQICRMSDCYGGPTFYTAPWSNDDELKLLEKLASKIRGHDFNAGIAAGQGGQTISQIGKAASQLAGGIKALKRGDSVGDIVKALNGTGNKSLGKSRNGKYDRERGYESEHRDVELSRRWLESSYGWLPLLQDVDEAARALANYNYARRQPKFRATSKKTTSGTVGSSLYQKHEGYSVRKEQIIYKFEDDDTSGLLSDEQALLGIQDPASIAWELVPWSFAIDWFMPIGSYLQNLNIIPRLRGKYVRTTTHVKTAKISHIDAAGYWILAPNPTRTYKPEGIWSNDYTHIAAVNHRFVSVSRRVGSGGIPIPRPNFKNPFSESLMRTLNQIALLGSLRGKYR